MRTFTRSGTVYPFTIVINRQPSTNSALASLFVHEGSSEVWNSAAGVVGRYQGDVSTSLLDWTAAMNTAKGTWVFRYRQRLEADSIDDAGYVEYPARLCPVLETPSSSDGQVTEAVLRSLCDSTPGCTGPDPTA